MRGKGTVGGRRGVEGGGKGKGERGVEGKGKVG